MTPAAERPARTGHFAWPDRLSALYRYDAQADLVLVLAVKHQRENGYHGAARAGHPLQRRELTRIPPTISTKPAAWYSRGISPSSVADMSAANRGVRLLKKPATVGPTRATPIPPAAVGQLRGANRYEHQRGGQRPSPLLLPSSGVQGWQSQPFASGHQAGLCSPSPTRGQAPRNRESPTAAVRGAKRSSTFPRGR